MPASLGQLPKSAGVWSKGPVYKRLDSDFLQRPLIPRAPLAPRLRIDQVNGSLRVVDPVHNPDTSAVPETVSLPVLARPLAPQGVADKPRVHFQVLAGLVGFVAGILAAMLFGWL